MISREPSEKRARVEPVAGTAYPYPQQPFYPMATPYGNFPSFVNMDISY